MVFSPVPELIYESRSGLKSPLIEPVNNKFIPKSASKIHQSLYKINFFLVKDFVEKFELGKEEYVADKKIENIKNQLGSKKKEDIVSNAKLLAEILKNFSFSFNIDVYEILELVKEEKGPVNLQVIRNKLFKKMN